MVFSVFLLFCYSMFSKNTLLITFLTNPRNQIILVVSYQNLNDKTKLQNMIWTLLYHYQHCVYLFIYIDLFMRKQVFKTWYEFFLYKNYVNYIYIFNIFIYLVRILLKMQGMNPPKFQVKFSFHSFSIIFCQSIFIFQNNSFLRLSSNPCFGILFCNADPDLD